MAEADVMLGVVDVGDVHVRLYVGGRHSVIAHAHVVVRRVTILWWLPVIPGLDDLVLFGNFRDRG